MDILLAPIYSFFNISFYRRVIQSSLGKGFLLFLYLSILFSLLIVFAFAKQGRPVMDQFVNWFTDNLPQLTLTKQGIVAQVEQPFEMKNPMYGSVLIINTSTDSLDKIPDTTFYLTKTKLVYRDAQKGQYRVFNLSPETDESKAKWQDLVITGPLLNGWYKKLIPFAFLVIFIFVIPFVFIWKLIAALFYSLIALLINFFRKERLKYSKLLLCSMFAMTPVAVLQLFSIFIPRISMVLNFWVALVLTSLYLALAILLTQEKKEDVI